MLIARTREKESRSEDGVFWWREYRLRKDKSEGLWLVEMRYMSRVGDKIYARIDGKTDMFTDPDTTWRRWTSGNTPSEAIRDVIGDTAFFNAESLSPVHTRIVNETRLRREESARIEAEVTKAKNALQEIICGNAQYV